MLDMGEVAADIGLEHVAHLLGHDLRTQGPQGVVRAAPRPEAETAVEKVRFEDSLQYARNRSLQQPVCDGGNAQRPRSALARPFGYFDPSDRWRSVGACFELFADFLDPLLHLTGKPGAEVCRVTALLRLAFGAYAIERPRMIVLRLVIASSRSRFWGQGRRGRDPSLGRGAR